MIGDSITPKRRVTPRLLFWIFAVDTVIAGIAILWFASRPNRAAPPTTAPPAALAPPAAPSMAAPPVVGAPVTPQR